MVNPVKRNVFWILCTLTVLVLLLGYRTSTSSQAGAGAEISAVAPVTGSVRPMPMPTAADATSGASAAPRTTRATSSSGPSSPDSSDSPDSSATSSDAAASSQPPSPPQKAGTITGDPADTKFGPVQVEITVDTGTITGVSVVDYPSRNGKDQRINARALPVLVQETLDLQSSGIDMVSGATATSKGYIASLQSALDRAGL
jgi:uncharacterized protein with FMN-binding domain